MNSRCRVCGTTLQSAPIIVKEMMFGLREPFAYLECGDCGCLQIDKYPADMARYYPPDYYSFHLKTPHLKESPIQRAKLLLMYFARLGYRMVNPARPVPWPVRLGLSPFAKILDIGCGNGARLMEWFNLGMTNLHGIDAFISDNKAINNSIRLVKGDFYLLTDRYDLVMMNEALEHLPDQPGVFNKANQLLDVGGKFFIRIPVKSWAWQHYGVDWVQWDAPRHFYIHTTKSIERLAAQSGFVVSQVIYDSWEFQFTGSELYRRGIPLKDAHLHPFSPAERKSFQDRSVELNNNGEGDQAAFVLIKKRNL